MCESYNLQYGTNFISVMPTNLYGPNDNFNLETSHVLPSLIRKIYLGKCLEENNWEAIRKDLDKRPIESVNGESEILKILSKYSITIATDHPLALPLRPLALSSFRPFVLSPPRVGRNLGFRQTHA